MVDTWVGRWRWPVPLCRYESAPLLLRGASPDPRLRHPQPRLTLPRLQAQARTGGKPDLCATCWGSRDRIEGGVAMAVEVVRHRFTVEEYRRMGETGIFTEDDRVELIDGEILHMAAIGSPHGGCVSRINRLFVLATGKRAVVSVQNPVRLGPHSEPQPDLALLRPRDDFYARAHPGPDEVWLVVEVADTTLGFDREVKIPLYARAGIREVWIVDLAGEAVEVYRRPSADGYTDVRRQTRGQRLTCEAYPDLSVSVDEILG